MLNLPTHGLEIFPEAGFDQSVMTPVLLGVLVSWFFTETLGWVFAGLVVPGYLASVFLMNPTGGLIDVFEALLTYGLARLLGEHLSRTGLTSRVFGRERFFLVVLASVLVRLGVEGLLLPRLVPHAPWAFSLGLVVVPLMANACWKTGLVRGVVQNGVPTLLVYLFVARVLVPYTNFSLQGFELSTENVAASFLASPKAYVLLLTGAMVAAAANLRYGWDFNGILVPALLGLVVLHPVKLVATLVEAAILVALVAALRAFTRLGRTNMEGPRRIVVYFAADYALRFAFAAVLGRRVPGWDVVDLMGFGYLLPALLAVKISEKQSVPVVLLPAAMTSVVAFAAGSAIGFLATLADGALPPRAGAEGTSDVWASAGRSSRRAEPLDLESESAGAPPPPARAACPASLTSAADLALALDSASAAVAPLDGAGVATLERFVLPLFGAKSGDAAGRGTAERGARHLGYSLCEGAPSPTGVVLRVLLPADTRPVTVVRRMGAKGGPVVLVPRGHDRTVRDVAVRLAVALDARAIVVDRRPHGSSSTLAEEFVAAHHAFLEEDDGTSFVVFHGLAEGHQDDGTTAVSSFGAPSLETATRTREALGAIGAPAVTVDLSFRDRELAARLSAPRGAVVFASGTAATIAAASFRATRPVIRFPGERRIVALDGDEATVAARLARDLALTAPPATVSNPTLGTLGTLGSLAALQRFVAERSIVARRTMDDALASGALRAALTHGAAGEHLVVALREAEGDGVILAAFPLEGPVPTGEVRVAGSVETCALTIVEAGPCRAPRP